MSLSRGKRLIRIDSRREFHGYADWQSLFMDMQTGWLIPDTEIWSGPDLVLRINALGCKGPELEPDLPVIACFGDSVTMGISQGMDSWPARIDVPGCQPLNAAIEGHNMARAVERYRQIAARTDLAAAVFYTGWHNIIYGEHSESHWRTMLDTVRGPHVTAFCTLATCLLEECRTRGVGPLLNSDVDRTGFANYFEYNRESYDKRYFNFWCNEEPSTENIGRILDGVTRFNTFLDGYCRERGAILIDAARFLRPACYDDIPRDFFDVCHFRPAAYKRVGAFVTQAIADAVARHLAERTPVRRRSIFDRLLRRRPLGGAAPVGARSGDDDRDLRKNIYPLW
ncbi:MAG: hypothetical protein K8S99_18535 [Planctomycetes bacterium]|nr:hypothetical protein [Planctomycetota bacterium]